MMDAAGILVILGQDDAVATALVDLADMFAVAADDFHMFGNAGESAALALPFGAPIVEVIMEARAVFLAIFGIVAIQLVDPLLASAGRAASNQS